jgi:hypothetical protein
VNASGLSPLSTPSNAVTPVGPAGAPTAVTASRANASASVTWTAPLNTGGSAISGYLVQVRIGLTLVSTISLAGLSTSTVVNGLTNGTAYNFRVQAVTAFGAGTLSAASPAVTPATTPGSPVLRAVTSGVAGGPRTVAVNWTPPASNGGTAITNYMVSAYDAGNHSVQVVFVGAAVRSKTFTFGSAGPFTFDVSAVNAIGTGSASVRSAPTTAL